jgi:hypothetical protein
MPATIQLPTTAILADSLSFKMLWRPPQLAAFSVPELTRSADIKLNVANS